MPHSWSPAKNSHAKAFGSVRFTDEHGRHFGTLDFQDGPFQEFGVNGVTNEQVIAAVIERLEALNTQPFACRENSLAITNLQQARMWLNERTRLRIERNIEGQSIP